MGDDDGETAKLLVGEDGSRGRAGQNDGCDDDEKDNGGGTLEETASRTVPATAAVAGRLILGREQKTTVAYLFWTEKLWLLLDFLQIFALLWSLSQPWPWPVYWLRWTRWTVYSNGDYFSTTREGARMGTSKAEFSEFGEMRYYLLYAAAAACVPLLLVLCYVVAMHAIKVYGKRADRYCRPIQAGMLVFLQVLYLPVGLATSRLLYCTNGDLDVDPRISCGSLWHLIVSSFACTLANALLLGLPYFLRQHETSLHLYVRESDQEKWLQAQEISHMLALSPDWTDMHGWTVSSFRHCGVHFRSGALLVKFCLLACYIALRNAELLQATLFWLVILLCTVWCFVMRPFRCWSSNLTLSLLVGLLLASSTFGLMTANNAQSAVMVATTQSLWLAGINGAGLALLLLFWLVLAISYPALDGWPSNRTLAKMTQTAGAQDWVSCVRDVLELKVRCAVAAPAVVPMDVLEESMRRLRECWLSAKMSGSLLEVVLRENLEDLARMHQVYRPQSYVDAEDGRMQSAAIALAPRLRSRHQSQLLMNPSKRSILLKLLTLRAMIGDRHIASAFPDKRAVQGLGQIGPARSGGLDALQRIEEGQTQQLVGEGAARRRGTDAVDLDTPDVLLPMTEELLIPPVTIEREPSLAGLARRWKRWIHTWEDGFAQAHGEKASIAVKRQHVEWYNSYNRVKEALELLHEELVDRKAREHDAYHARYSGLSARNSRSASASASTLASPTTTALPTTTTITTAPHVPERNTREGMDTEKEAEKDEEDEDEQHMDRPVNIIPRIGSVDHRMTTPSRVSVSVGRNSSNSNRQHEE